MPLTSTHLVGREGNHPDGPCVVILPGGTALIHGSRLLIVPLEYDSGKVKAMLDSYQQGAVWPPVQVWPATEV